MPSFTTTIDSLLKILKEWNYYKNNLVDVIKIALTKNDAIIIGTRKDKLIYNKLKLIFKLDLSIKGMAYFAVKARWLHY